MRKYLRLEMKAYWLDEHFEVDGEIYSVKKSIHEQEVESFVDYIPVQGDTVPIASWVVGAMLRNLWEKVV